MFEVDFHILNQKATPAIYADTLANRPVASFAGRLFIDTALPYGIYRDTGTAWVQIAGSGGGGSSTGINGLNGTTNIGLGGTLTSNTTIAGNSKTFDLNNAANINLSTINGSLNNSLIVATNYVYLQALNSSNSNTNQFLIWENKTQSIFNNANFGLLLDDSTGKFSLGDYSNARKYNSFVVNDDANTFYLTTSYNQVNNNQDLFYASNATSSIRFVKIGDFNNYANSYSLIVDDANEYIKTQNTNGDNGIVITNSFTFIGAQNPTDNIYFSVDIGNSAISSYYNTFQDGIDLDFVARNFRLGGFNVGTTFLEVNDNIGSFTFNTSNLVFTGAALQSNTSSGNSGEHLVITLNGTQYKIALQNP